MRPFCSLRAPATVVAALLCGIPAAAARGQRARPAAADSVPRDLVIALLRPMPTFQFLDAGGGTPQIELYVGTLPPADASRLFVPPGATVLGASVVGELTTVLLHVPGSPDSATTRMRRGLANLAWSPAAPPASAPSGGGFRPAPGPHRNAVELCRDTVALVMDTEPAGADETLVTLEIIASSRRPSGCGAPVRRLMPGIPLPTLVNPPQAVEGFACQTGNSFSTSTSGFAQTPMSMAAMLDYYGAQLRDSGWTVVPAPATVLGRT